MEWNLIQQRLASEPENWAAIARATGLPRMTIARIGGGDTPAPRVDTAQKIADYYARLDSPGVESDQAA